MPTALKTAVGFGDRVEIMSAHLKMSGSCRDWSLGDWLFGSLLEIVFTDENVPVDRRVARIWEPTAPVQPNTAAVAGVVVIVGMGIRKTVRSKRYYNDGPL